MVRALGAQKVMRKSQRRVMDSDTIDLPVPNASGPYGRI